MNSGKATWASRQQHYSRRPMNLLAVAALLLVLAFTLACESDGNSGATSAPTTGPISTATPTPTLPPSPTPEPTTPTGGATAPPVDQALFEALLAPIPADFGIVAFVDVAALAQDPELARVLEAQGLPEAFGPAGAAIQSQLAGAVMASMGGGVIGVLRGPLVIPDLIEGLTLLGAAVETRTSGEFEVVSLTVNSPILNLSLALTTLDEETFIFATRAIEKAGAPGLVVSALEALSGAMPGFASEKGVPQILEAGLPAGIAITIFKGCEAFGDAPGCQAWAVGFSKEADSARMRAKLSFESPETAQAALPVVQQILAEDTDFTGEATVEGSLVLIKGNVPSIGW